MSGLISKIGVRKYNIFFERNGTSIEQIVTGKLSSATLNSCKCGTCMLLLQVYYTDTKYIKEKTAARIRVHHVLVSTDIYNVLPKTWNSRIHIFICTYMYRPCYALYEFPGNHRDSKIKWVSRKPKWISGNRNRFTETKWIIGSTNKFHKAQMNF